MPKSIRDKEEAPPEAVTLQPIEAMRLRYIGKAGVLRYGHSGKDNPGTPYQPRAVYTFSPREARALLRRYPALFEEV